MSSAGLLASWAAALFAAWAFVGGLAGQAPGHPARRSARRALLASAIAAIAATTALLALLLAGDVTVSYVARSLARNVPAPYRLAAIWNLPAGAVLPTAALAAGAGVIATARARGALGVAAAGAIVMALCAASLAAAPFATLPWVPIEGLGLAPTLQHPWSVLGHTALSVGIALAAAEVVRAAGGLADGVVTAPGISAPSALSAATLAAVAVAAWATARGAYAAGGGASPAPLAAWGGALVPALVAVLLARQAQRAGGVAALGASLGALGLLCVVLLGARVRGPGSVAVAAFAVVSLGAAASGAAAAARLSPSGVLRVLAHAATLTLVGGGAAAFWLAGSGLQWLGTLAQWLLAAGGVATALTALAPATAGGSVAGRGALATSGALAGAAAGVALGLWLAPARSPAIAWSMLAGLALTVASLRLAEGGASLARLPRALVALAAASLALAAAGEGHALTSSITLASGARDDVAMRLGAPVTLVHQGVSRYQDRNAHVIAVAIEPWREARPLPLLSLEQREYVDSRDESLGPAVLRPVTFGARGEEVRIALDDVTADEGVRLTVSVVPFAAGWSVALALLVLAAIVQAVARFTAFPSSIPAVYPPA